MVPPERWSDLPPKIDARDIDTHLNGQSSQTSGQSSPQRLLRDNESLLSNVVDGIIENDRRLMKQELARYLSYVSAILNALCAGSITAFSLYAHMFVSRLHYNLYNVNAISIAAELATYLPVSIFGYFVDRYSPRPVAFCSALLFATGYFLAALTYRAGPHDQGGWPFSVMLVAFVFVGMGTSSMYLAAVTTCAKNFGQSKYKGTALALPIAAFGLSGMWQSQVGSHFLYEVNEDDSRGNVDVFRYFIFLGITLLIVGLIGTVFQKIIDEEELIEDAVEGLSRSGLLEDSPFFQRPGVIYDAASNHRRYGTIDEDDDYNDADDMEDLTASMVRAREEERQRKLWLLNNETRRYLSDSTMWLLAFGFFLVTGPVETFINNLSTMLGALYPPSQQFPASNSPALNVSILTGASTLARVVVGIVSDLLSPSPDSSTHAQYSALTPTSLRTPNPSERRSTGILSRISTDIPFPWKSRSTGSQQEASNPFLTPPEQGWSISRLTLLIISTILLPLGYILLISPIIESRPSAFIWVSALLGTVNGAAFALVPLLISAVWGVQNFGTNWGIVAMMPAFGATVWSALYSANYQAHVDPSGLCFGQQCFRDVSIGMSIAGILAMLSFWWIGWGRNGWWSRGVVV